MSSSPARYFPGILVRRDPTQRPILNNVDSVSVSPCLADNVDDETLILQLPKDIEALGLLYRRYARLVYTICLRILRNSTEAEDVVHEIFLCLHRKCKSFDAAKGNARSWIIQLAYSKCFDWRDYLSVRNRHKQEQEQSEADRSSATCRREDMDPAYVVLWSPRMLAAFKSLSEEQQLALRLFYFQGFTFREIAEKQGYSYGNAKHHIYRGIERLRNIVFEGAGRQTRTADVQELTRQPEGSAG